MKNNNDNSNKKKKMRNQSKENLNSLSVDVMVIMSTQKKKMWYQNDIHLSILYEYIRVYIQQLHTGLGYSDYVKRGCV